MGGAEAFRKIESLRIRGTVRIGGTSASVFTVLAKRSGAFRLEMDAGPDHVVQNYDGAAGWQTVTGSHRQPDTPLTGDPLAYLRDQAANAIGGPLVEMQQRGNQAEVDGNELIDGVACYRLKLMLASGHKRVVFIDSTTFLEVLEETQAVVGRRVTVIQQSVGDYRKFGHILVPCRIITREKNMEDSQQMHIETVEINPGS